jgi:hypothetical protein
MDNVTPIRPSLGDDAVKGIDCVLAARAILACYIETIPDERAEDRYVLWAVRDKMDEAANLIEGGV